MAIGVEEATMLINSMKQDIIDAERKRIAEIIEDLYKPDMKNSYDEGFNAALMVIHDKVMF